MAGGGGRRLAGLAADGLRLWPRPCCSRLPMVSPSWPPSGSDCPLLPPAPPLPPSPPKSAQSAQPPPWPEQALAHLLELGIGRVGIVEDAVHVRIDPRLGPRARRSRRECRARPDRWRGPGLRWSSRASARRGTPHLGAEIDGAGAGHLHQRADQIEIGGRAPGPCRSWNDAESCDRSVVFSLLSCQPDSVLAVSERIICATLRP